MAPTRGWTPAAHEDLLLCFIEEAFAKGDNKKALITGVTEKMKQRGHVFSYDAIKYYILTFFPYIHLVSLFISYAGSFSISHFAHDILFSRIKSNVQSFV